MKTAIFSILFTICSLMLLGQETMNVKLKIVYKNLPLCNWTVTIKHGDVALAEGMTDEHGIVEYKNVRLLSRAIDAYGNKPHNGGDKHWDVTGYLLLDNNGYAELRFEELIKEIGVSESMLESAWGLTINDCGQAQKTEPAANQTQPSGTITQTAPTPAKEPEKSPEQLQQEGYENLRTSQKNKIASLESKITKRMAEREKTATNSTEYSDLSYEIKDLELEKEITKVKLEKTEKQIAKGYKPLEKYEKIPLEDREDQLSEEQKALKKQQKEGIPFGGVKTEAAPETKRETAEEITKAYTASELGEMSTIKLKKLKVDMNTTIAKRKMTLKTKGAFLKPDEKATIGEEIGSLGKQVELIELELAKRETEK